MTTRPDDDNGSGKQESVAQRSFGSTMIAILWSFIGLRRKSDFERDVEGAMNPVYVIIAGLIVTLLFIGALMLAVRFALS